MTKNGQSEYILIFFRGCPSVDIARDLLRDVGIQFTEICQDDLLLEDELRKFASPTLLDDGEIVFGCRLSQGGMGCSIDLPTEYQLLSHICGKNISDA